MPSEVFETKLKEKYKNANQITIWKLLRETEDHLPIGSIEKGNSVQFYLFMSEVFENELKFWNVGKDLFETEAGQNQALETMRLIVERYRNFRIDDFKMVFKMAKLGDFGPVYNRMDGPTILDWFKKYNEKREETRSQMARNRMFDEDANSDKKIEFLLSAPASELATPEQAAEIEAARQRAMDKLRSIELQSPMKTFTEAEIKAGEERSKQKEVQRAANEQKVAQERKKQHDALFNGVSKEQYIADCVKHGIPYDAKDIEERFKDSENV